jgi:hypothetical protein
MNPVFLTPPFAPKGGWDCVSWVIDFRGKGVALNSYLIKICLSARSSIRGVWGSGVPHSPPIGGTTEGNNRKCIASTSQSSTYSYVRALRRRLRLRPEAELPGSS